MRRSSWGILLALLACREPQAAEEAETPASQLSEGLCRWIVECGCEIELADDETRCRDALTDLFALEHASAEAAGLTFDEACVASEIETLDAQACTRDSGPKGRCIPPCQVFHGTVEVGQACRWHGNFHDCRQGLACGRDDGATDLCFDPCCSPPPSGEGGACSPMGPPCEQGLFCVPVDAETGEGVCTPPLGPGEPCPNGGCRNDLYCDYADDVCRTYADIGEPCTTIRCASPAYCDESDPNDPVCREPPERGQPCPNGWCASGSYCDDTGPDPVCVEPEANGSPCEWPEECESEHCEDSVCSDPPIRLCEFVERRLTPLPS